MSGDALIDLLKTSAPERAAGSRLQVAFSGGVDSTVLLHALVGAGFENVAAVHVHHGLQAIADDWVVHCESVCRSLAVPLSVRRVQVRPDGQGWEAAAREARYAALEAGLEPGDVLVTAHHRGDQAETVLLNLMRGSGLTGLSGMAALRPLGPGRLWRPFLETGRDRLIEYARRHALHWVEDPHNRDPRFARSFLRSEILPRLSQHWPSVEERLGRAGTVAADSAALLREVADADLEALLDRDTGCLSVTALRTLAGPRRRNLVRRWVQRLGLDVPGHETLLHFDREVLDSASDAMPVLAWPGGEFRRHRDHVYAMRVLPPVPAAFRAQWDGRSAFELPRGCGVLEPQGMGTNPSPWTVRMARPSDRFRPGTAGRTRTLKNLFQEGGVPTWVRERTPLLALDEKPVWVGGFGWSVEGTAAASVRALDIAWRHDLPGAPHRP